MKNKGFFLTSCVSLVLIFLGNALFSTASYRLELTIAWTVAFVCGLSGALLHDKAMKTQGNRFFFIALIVNPVRLVISLFVLFYLKQILNLENVPFFLSFFIAYFVFMIYDVSQIYKLK